MSQSESKLTLNIEDMFATNGVDDIIVDSGRFRRIRKTAIDDGYTVLLDSFASSDATCCFLRVTNADINLIRFALQGCFRIEACKAGGFLILGAGDQAYCYWVPHPAVVRESGVNGHILHEHSLILHGFEAGSTLSAVELGSQGNGSVDCVVWRIPVIEDQLTASLLSPGIIEIQKYFLWGSHTVYDKPASLFCHLLNGYVYENRVRWPFNWRIYSENDAHSLYVLMSGLLHATSRELYDLFRLQLLYSVVCRQGKDGAWRHGEWSDSMECHYRLHTSAIHMLLDALEEANDSTLRAALDRAVEYISRQHDTIASGIWFLHDEMETSRELMNKSPFSWVPGRVLGKSETNTLVLNTHLDITIALDRYAAVTGNHGYAGLVESARSAAQTILELHTADWLYKPLFKAIKLVLLPTSVARKLPIPTRAIKRIAWKYVIPRLARIKSVYPRLVMPGGYIDRALSIGALADPYHSINIMDLARYQRRFASGFLTGIIDDALQFAETNKLYDYWLEKDNKRYALGFMAEALYHLCTVDDAPHYRERLADMVLLLEHNALGMPPSLLGSNNEATGANARTACPVVDDECIRIANLSRDDITELLVINTSGRDMPLPPAARDLTGLKWSGATGSLKEAGASVAVPARSWLLGRG